MIRLALCSLLFLSLFLIIPAFAWPDSAGDTFGSSTPPALDLTDLVVAFGPDIVEIELTFNPATTNAGDLNGLGGFVDFDIDLDENTGRPPHIEEYGFLPYPVMGVEYFVIFYPFTGIAELIYVDTGVELSAGFYNTTINGTTVSVTLPQCNAEPLDGICLGANYRLSALIGNSDGPTDRTPNDANALLGTAGPGDFDADGDVDDDDFDEFAACATRATVLYVPGTFPAGCMLDPDGFGIIPADFDEDGDVDQDDFGEFQRNITGPF